MSSMAKQKQKPEQNRGGFWSELFQFGLYKPNQGRIVRQVSFFTIALLGLLRLGKSSVRRCSLEWGRAVGW